MAQTIYLHNIRSLRNKYEEIEVIPTTHNKPDIIALTETWTNTDDEHLYTLENYNAEHFSRQGKGGGITLYIKEEIDYKNTTKNNLNGIEIIQIETNDKTIITLIYKPPHVKYKKFKKVLSTNLLLNTKKPHIIIGDMNINIAESNRNTEDYINTIKEKGYKIMNKTEIQHQTRPNKGENHSIIDHVITNQKERMKDITIIQTDISDHNAILTKWEKANEQKKTTYKTYTYVETNHEQINEEIKKLTNINNLEELSTTIMQIIERNQHTSKIKRKENNPWINQNIISIINERNKLYQRHKKNPTNEFLHQMYKKKKRETQSIIKNVKKEHITQKFKQYEESQQKTWKFLNKLINRNNKTSTEIKEILKSDKTSAKDNQEMANIINHYFTTIGKTLAEEQITNAKIEPITTKTTRTVETAQFTETSPEEIKQTIQNLENNKAPGFDKITNKILKENIVTLAPIIATNINKILKEGNYPQILKTTIIKPIHKGGSKTNPENYRPIALLSTINKVIEKLIQLRITEHLNIHKIINPQQYAFQQNKGTTSAVMDIIHDIKNKLDNNEKTLAIFIDMKKAFDTISKPKLLEKLESIGIKDINLKIIKTYIYNRKQTTIVNNTKSETQQAEYGIPQGGNLPPTLYIIYTNDFFELPLEGKPYIYADDTCLLYSANTDKELEEKIKKDMPIIENWYYNNLLTINEKKTNYIKFNDPDVDINITIKGETIPRIHNTKYLGITIQDNLKWDKHISCVKNKNARAIASIRKIKHIMPTKIKKQIYHSIFMANNTYLINIWSDTTEYNLNKIQRQQNSMLKIIYGLKHRTPTKEVYSIADELNIRQTIILHGLTIIHKITKNKLKTNLKLPTNSDIHEYNTREQSNIRTQPTKRKKNNMFITTEAVNKYNKLDNNTKDLNTKTFKIKIKHLLKHNKIK